ncbi:hypothetical protein ACJVDH_02595 [Pedobacter sp. AW1-32]|uniref:hypothetical protein n=1 Tax=Pedobacter sp. AW1-32 TaxID=3383026 RepID=UPI003FEF4E18
MEIRIEASQEQLKDLYIYLNDHDIETDEQYQELNGFHLEASLQSIIVVLTTLSLAAIRGYFKLQLAKIKAQADLDKNAQKVLLDQWKFSAKQSLDWKKLELKELEMMEKRRLREEKQVLKKVNKNKGGD